MAQNVYPTSDASNTFLSGGFGDIDEGATPSDSDFAYTADKPSSETLEVHVGNPTDPEVSTGHIVRYRWATVDGGVLSGSGTPVTITPTLYQGAVLRSSGTPTTTNTATFTDASWTLSGAEADAIGSDYSDLRIRWVVTGGAGSGANRRGGAISWAELEVPNAPVPTTTSVARLGLASGSDPSDNTNHSIKVRARTTTGSNGVINAALYEGASNRSGNLASSALSTSLADIDLPIAEASAANITSYADLEIRLWGTTPNGALTFEVDYVVFSLPGVAGPQPYKDHFIQLLSQ